MKSPKAIFILPDLNIASGINLDDQCDKPNNNLNLIYATLLKLSLHIKVKLLLNPK